MHHKGYHRGTRTRTKNSRDQRKELEHKQMEAIEAKKATIQEEPEDPKVIQAVLRSSPRVLARKI